MALNALSDAEIVRIAEPIMDNLMEGSTEINHAKHTRDFTDRMKSIVTSEHLERVCRDYQAKWGVFKERKLVGIFRRKESVALVWKQKCSNTTDEFVAEIVLVETGGRHLVDHAYVY